MDFRRYVETEADGPSPAVIVTEFFAHGELTQDNRNLVVTTYKNKQHVPWRLLQMGPGDFCRVAFQASDRQAKYYLYYGGKKDAANTPPPPDPPPWTETAGLLLETRRWKSCDLRRRESVRQAFATSKPIGNDYVPDVFHRRNPFDIAPGPFLSRYHGVLNIPKAGNYTFYTSSQDCSFLLIDGHSIVAAPGLHPPVHRARFRGDVTLQAGPHSFEYLHAAQGNDACMVAAWKPPDSEKPVRIPPSRFGNDRVSRLPAGQLEHRRERFMPDFRVAVLGEVPLDNSPRWMLRAQFANTTARTGNKNTRFHWDFGDGQTSADAEPAHIYLHAGQYSVTLSARSLGKRRTTVNKVSVSRPTRNSRADKFIDTLTEYMPLLATYDPQRLDSQGTLQLVRAFLQAEDPAQAAEIGQNVFHGTGPPRDERFYWDLARLLGPILRDRTSDSQAAWKLWQEASRKVRRKEWAASCALRAADIALNDLLLRDEATPLLQFATDRMADSAGDEISQLQHLWGDWYARGGQREEARASYRKAAQACGTGRGTIEQNAWRGARSRSTEAMLQGGKLAQARDELRRWNHDFPADKVRGYLPLLLAQYWLAAGKLPNAIAVASDLLTVNPDSPYADQLLLLWATCEEQRGNLEPAVAAYQALLTDYPGSPLVKTARQRLARLKQER